MRSIVNPAPFVVDQSVSGSFVGSLRLPAQADEHPKPLILCWRLETLIVTSEDCAAPPPHVPDPPSTPTVCTVPPSAGEIPPSDGVTPSPLLLPELDPAPELDEAPTVEPLLEPEDPLEPSEVPELAPLELGEPPELDALPELEDAVPLWGELPVVELLPHALTITARHARDPVSAEWRRPLLVTLSMSMIGKNSPGIVLPASAASRQRSASSPLCSGSTTRNPSHRAPDGHGHCCAPQSAVVSASAHQGMFLQ
jgi:hypothetical protein